jgi:lysyl-tRNA synthetase, class II
MLADGIEPYPVVLPCAHSLREAREAHQGLGAHTSTGDVVGVAGRVMFLRNTGKL